MKKIFLHSFGVDPRSCELISASAANFLTAGHTEPLERLIAEHPDRWEAILRWEERAAAAEGALDGGTHIIFVVRKS